MPKTSFNRENINITLLEGIHSDAVETFARAGYTSVTQLAGTRDGDPLIDTLRDTHILGIRSRTQLTADILSACPRLMAVGCFCIGTNQVDKPAAEHLGIPVFNAPFSNTRSVAELVLGEIIMLLRGAFTKSMALHQTGAWQKSAKDAFEARGKTLGIIGYGHIGSQVALLAEAIGMDVQYVDIEPKLSLGNHKPCKSLEDLLATSDVVSLHVPETTDTQDMINTNALKHMKEGAYLINASRGTVVDVDALAEALQSGHLKGAAVDVFPTEPKTTSNTLASPLRTLDNVILTPHIGGSTQEAQRNIAVEVANKLVRYSDTGATLGAVNFPEISLSQQSGVHRLLHIHKNQPGVMIALNNALAQNGANILGQHLQTTTDTGYVITDVHTETTPNIDAIKAVEGTIRTRVLF